MNSSLAQKTWLALNRLQGLSAKDITHLTARFDDLETVFKSSDQRLRDSGFSESLIQQVHALNWTAVETELAWLEKPDHHLLTLSDEIYPALLREIPSPPIVLFVEGDVRLLQQPQLAMVGSRNPTPIGVETAESFARYLAEKGWIITSGLAMGIDAASHRGALTQGKTIAVLGCGIDQLYPPKNKPLAERIVKSGAIVSEFPLGTQPTRVNFPRRNRIISGLCLGVLVVEAAIKSGSLITAKFAADQGREIFAIPGSIHNPLSKGCHYLIRHGAKLVETAEDIEEELASFFSQKEPVNPEGGKEKERSSAKNRSVFVLDKDYRKLLSCVGFEPTAIDTLVIRSGFFAENVSSMLLIMELESYIKSVIGGYVRLKS